MATDISDIVKQGYVRVRSKNVGVWQRRWIVLRRASSKGPCRMEKFVDEKSARNGVNHKTLVLSNVSTVSRLPSATKKHGFAINFNDTRSKWLCSDSDFEADAWVKLLLQECLVVRPGLATGEPDVLSPGIEKELQEQFHVHLLPTPKLDVFGECLLQVTHENIYLWDVANSKHKLVAWPLTALRRYGSDPTKFTFEAGRHCATGEGMFVFHTLEGEKIYRKVHQATLAIAEAHHKLRRHNTSDVIPSRSNGVDVPKTSCRAAAAYSADEDSSLSQAGDSLADRELTDFIRQQSNSCSHRSHRHHCSFQANSRSGSRARNYQ